MSHSNLTARLLPFYTSFCDATFNARQTLKPFWALLLSTVSCRIWKAARVAALSSAKRSSPEEAEEQRCGEEPPSEAAGPLCLGCSPHTSFRGQRWAHGPVACVESSLCFPSLSPGLMNRPLATVGPLWESTFGQKRKKEKRRDRRRETLFKKKKKEEAEERKTLGR